MTRSNYEILIYKLEEFKKKFYLNRLLKGLLLSLAMILGFYLVVNVFEYAARLPTTARTILFYVFITGCAFILVKYLCIPLFKLLNLGKTISYEEASLIIGKHFNDVQDKLINTLQLRQQGGDNELILASIDQKIKELSPLPFKNAIDLRSNLRYARFALIPVLLLVIILFTNSSMLTESTRRLLHYSVPYEKMAPFSFHLNNTELKCYKGGNFTLHLSIEGKEIPLEVMIEQDGNKFRMSRLEAGEYEFTFNNVQKETPFRFWASGFVSDDYLLGIIPRASIADFNIQLDYPAYLGKASEKLKNQGDITIPEGTGISWSFRTTAVSNLQFRIEQEMLNAEKTGKEKFQFKKVFRKNSTYAILIFNEYTGKADTLEYHINVIPDSYPVIAVKEERDTASRKWLYFAGNAADDHGISRITFNYRFTKSADNAKISNTYKTNLIQGHSGMAKEFTHSWDLGDIGIAPDDEIEYFFEVWDNDAVNGAKSARSQVLTYNVPSSEQLRKQNEQNSKALKSEMADAVKETQQLNKEIEQLNRKLMDKNQMNWDDRKQFEKLLEKQRDLQKKMEDIKEQHKNNNEKQQEFEKKESEELMEKQNQLEKLFNETLTEEMKKKMEELEEMMKQMNKDEIQKELDDMKMDNKDLNKQLDRMLEMYKQLEVEKKMEKAIEDLKDLSKKQEELSEKTEKSNNMDEKTQEQLQKEQQQMDEKFEQLKEDLKDLEKKNEELETPNDLKMEELEDEKQEIDENQEQSGKQLQQKNNKGASQKQKKASDKMKEMAEQMEMQMEAQEQEQQAEDYDKLRQILENLVTVSHEEEDVMEQLKSVNNYSPQLVQLAQHQKKIKDDFKLIEDSLYELGKRVVQVQSYINKELNEANRNMDKALENLGKRWVPQARSHQNYAMTAMNNLAVMLSEALKNMQEQMNQASSSGKGKQQSKGKNKGKSMSEMKKMQQELNRQVEEMKKKQQGDNKGQGQGKQQGQGNQSKEWARIAAQQEAVRRQLQQLEKQLQKDGNSGKLGDLQKTQKIMDEVEKDLVNKRITPETLKRLKEIETRMFDHEKAEREQEMDNERKGETGKEQERKIPPVLEEYLKEKNREVELLQTLPPNIKPYYKEKVKEYYRLLNQ